MSTRKLTVVVITAAIDGFEAQKKRINAQIAELRQALNGGSSEAVAAPSRESRRPRRKLSAAARERMAEAQRKRWAAAKAGSRPIAPEAPRAKRKLSAAGRKRIIAATKKRWALVRAQKASAAKRAKSVAGR